MSAANNAAGRVASLGFLILSVGCALGMSEQQYLDQELSTPNPLPPSKNCPPPGAELPFSQIWSEAPHMVDCDVTSEVVLVASAAGCPQRLVAKPGERCFLVVSPNEYNPGGNTPAAQRLLLAPGATVEGLYAAKSGTPLRARGGMAVDADMGTLAFVASDVQPVTMAVPEPTSAPDAGTSRPQP